MAKKTRMMRRKKARKTKKRGGGGSLKKETPEEARTRRIQMANAAISNISNIASSSRNPSPPPSPSSLGSRSSTISSSQGPNSSPTSVLSKANMRELPSPEKKFLATGPCYSSQTCGHGLQCITTNANGIRHVREPGSSGKPGTCEYL
jgi:hypothetical protein